MELGKESFARYLPIESESEKWGWNLIDAGRQVIRGGDHYPKGGHPLGYLFDSDGKRVLEENQIIYIVSGSGSFESASYALTEVNAGDVILLFPGEWHRYYPNQQKGWSEYWMGFSGMDADRVMRTFFDRSKPLYRGAYGDELLQSFERLIYYLAHPVPGSAQIASSFIPNILAFLMAGNRLQSTIKSRDSQLVLDAKSLLLRDIAERTDLEALASELGVSYTQFRSVFRRETGYSPREYENIIKLNRSKDLLLSGQHNIGRVAELLGYSSVYYFSRAFKKAFGSSPKRWLRSQESKPS